MRNHTFEGKTNRARAILFILLASSLPVFFITYWVLQNNQLPISDGANFLSTAIRIYQRFIHGGFWSGLMGCYLERAWRPIFFPVLAVPFLLAYQGNLYASYSSVAIVCVLTSTIYLYLLFRLQLSRMSSVIATNMIGLLPFIQANAFMFYAESALFPCMMGCVYHLIKSNYLRSTKHVLALIVFITLAVIIRPVELILNLIFVLGLFLFLGWHKGIFSSKHLLKMIVLIMSVLLLFLFTCIIPHINIQVQSPTAIHSIKFQELIPNFFNHAIRFNMDMNLIDNGGIQDEKIKHSLLVLFKYVAFTTCILLSWMLVFNLVRRIKQNILQLKSKHLQPLLIPTVMIIVTLVVGWFYPFAFETYQWVYRTSIGDVAGTGSIISPQFSLWQAYQNLSIYWGGELVVFGLISLAALSIFVNLKKSHYKIFSPIVVYLLLIIPIPLLEVLLTIQASPRKLSIAFPAFLMILLILGLQRGAWRSIRVFLAMILLGTQFIVTMLVAFSGSFDYVPLHKLVGWQYKFVPATLKPNPHEVVIRFLHEQARIYHFKLVGIGVTDRSSVLIDPFLMTILAQAYNEPYNITYPYIAVFTPDAPRQLLQNGFDAIFVYDEIKRMTVSPETEQIYSKKYSEENYSPLKIIHEFLYYYSKDQLAEIGWKLGPCIDLKSVDLLDHRGCLLIPATQKNEIPVLKDAVA